MIVEIDYTAKIGHIQFELPTVNQVHSAIAEESKIDVVKTLFFENAVFAKGKISYIDGYAYYTWTQKDFGTPFEVHTLVQWTYYPNDDEWGQNVYSHYVDEDIYNKHFSGEYPYNRLKFLKQVLTHYEKNTTIYRDAR